MISSTPPPAHITAPVAPKPPVTAATPPAAPTAPAPVPARVGPTDAVQGAGSIGDAPALAPVSPAPPRDPSIIEDHHGRKVADPFRPLEQLDSPETVAWWKAQNVRTKELLAGSEAVRAKTIAWHEKMLDYTREGMGVEYGGNTFVSRQSGLESQPTYYVRSGGKDAPLRALIDPKTLLKHRCPSDDRPEPRRQTRCLHRVGVRQRRADHAISRRGDRQGRPRRAPGPALHRGHVGR